MKKQIALILFGALMASSAQAASKDVQKIGFVNDQELAQQSTALQGLQLQHDKMANALKKELEAEIKKIGEKENKIREGEKTMSKSELGAKIDELDKIKTDLQARVQTANQSLKENLTKAMMTFKDKAVTPVIKELAEENGFSAVLDSRIAFYVVEGSDVTEEAIARINKKMPKLDLKKVTLATETKKAGNKKAKK